MNVFYSFLSICLALSGSAFAAKSKGVVYANPAKAAEDPDFAVQGEYTGPGHGIQVVALGDGKFQALMYKGGLPGAGWDGKYSQTLSGGRQGGQVVLEGKSTMRAEIMDGVMTLTGWGIAKLKKLERKSPSLGAKPPSGAVVLFDGKTNHFKGKVDGELLQEGAVSKQEFGSFELHLEFRTPFKPHAKPGSQDRGNSGVYTFNRYETQVLDSFGIKPEFNYCGALYRFKAPDLNMCFPPLSWQTYDIHFTAPAFEDGKKVKNARITVRHNGVLVHDDVELPKGTGAGGGRPEIARGAIYLQGHGNPVRYRNIWILEK